VEFLIICIVKQIIRILLSYHGRTIDIARISFTGVVKILPTSSAITFEK
jgi:hypothetical protein